MKNVKKVAEESRKCKQSGPWLPIYYSAAEDAVYTEPGEGRYYLSDLIRECTEQEIIRAVYRCLSW